MDRQELYNSTLKQIKNFMEKDAAHPILQYKSQAAGVLVLWDILDREYFTHNFIDHERMYNDLHSFLYDNGS